MIRVREIIAVGADVAGMRAKDMLARDQRQLVARPRMRSMFVARRLRPEMSYPALGRAFEGRHHTTVLWAERKVEGLLAGGDNAERDAVCSMLARLGFEPDLDAAVAVVQQRAEVVARRIALQDRRAVLLAELKQLDRQLEFLTAGASR